MTPSATFIAPPPADAVANLLQRDGLEYWDEAGRDLSENIYNFGSVVEMHTDDSFANWVVLGYVLHGDFQLEVSGHAPIHVTAGMVYQLDPLVLHGVPSPSNGKMLIFFRDYAIGERPELAVFAQEGIEAAIALAANPEPPAEVLEFFA